MFNGIGNAGYDCVERRTQDLAFPAWVWTDLCKTERKAYDPVVTACLCHLSTATRVVGRDGLDVIGTEAFHVTSDGHGKDFAAGLDLARKALPELREHLDLPFGVMADDRWTSPWLRLKCKDEYEVRFCVDGRGYVLDKKNEQSACFASHVELAAFLAEHGGARFRKAHPSGGYDKSEINIWEASGMFDDHRERRIAKAQRSVLSKLFPSDARHPSAFVRPEDVHHSGRSRDLFDLLPDRQRPDQKTLF